MMAVWQLLYSAGRRTAVGLVISTRSDGQVKNFKGGEHRKSRESGRKETVWTAIHAVIDYRSVSDDASIAGICSKNARQTKSDDAGV